MYEIKPTALGAISPTYRTLLVHQLLGYDFVNGELPVKIFVPHFEMEHFPKREFMIEFNEKAFIKLSGLELLEMQGVPADGRTLSKEIAPILNRTIITDSDQIVEETNNITNPSPSTSNTLTNNQISPMSASGQVIQMDGEGIVEETIDKLEDFQVVHVEEIKQQESLKLSKSQSSSNTQGTAGNQKISFAHPAKFQRPLSTVGLI